LGGDRGPSDPFTTSIHRSLGLRRDRWSGGNKIYLHISSPVGRGRPLSPGRLHILSLIVHLLIRLKEESRRDSENTPKGSVRPCCARTRHAELPDVSGMAPASTVAAMVFSMNKEAGGDGSIGIHHFNEMREGEARSDGDGEVHNAVEGILEEAVVSADSAGDAAELLKVAADVLR
jgi:hypothetical protein